MVVEEKQNPLGYEKISTLVRKMAIPAIVANVVNALYNIVDQIFIGQGVGYLGNAATNIAFPITTICMAIGLMVGIGAASNFNLALGSCRNGSCVTSNSWINDYEHCTLVLATFTEFIWCNRSNFRVCQ